MIQYCSNNDTDTVIRTDPCFKRKYLYLSQPFNSKCSPSNILLGFEDMFVVRLMVVEQSEAGSTFPLLMLAHCARSGDARSSDA